MKRLSLAAALWAVAVGACRCGGGLNADEADLSWTPASLTLSAAAGGQASATVTLTNSGPVAAQVTSIAITDSTRPVFSVSTSGLDLEPGETSAVTVTYQPTTCLLPSGTPETATLALVTNAQNAPTADIPLTGLCAAGIDGGQDGGIADVGTDAGIDAGVDAGEDAGTDAGLDGGSFDAGLDAGADAGTDAGADAGPGPACYSAGPWCVVKA